MTILFAFVGAFVGGLVALLWWSVTAIFGFAAPSADQVGGCCVLFGAVASGFGLFVDLS